MKRTVKYRYIKIDYDKLKTNIAYKKSHINKLKFWFIYNEYNEELAFLWLYRKHKNQIHTYIKYFNIQSKIFYNQANSTKYFDKLFYSKNCLECNKEIISKNHKYCSNKCSVRAISKLASYKQKVSEGLIRHHKNMLGKDRLSLNKRISQGNKTFYMNETVEEKEKRIANIDSYKSLGWNNQLDYCEFHKLKVLFTEEEYVKGGLIKYECKNCLNIISIIKSTATPRPLCEKCYPIIKRKAKTQYSIYQYILDNSTAIDIRYNDKSFISTSKAKIELDILLVDKKFAIEFDGILNHSYGYHKSVVHFNNIVEEKKYHVNKTKLCEEKGIQLFHIFENEWTHDKIKKEIWKSVINNKLNNNRKIYARKTIIKEVSSKESKSFLINNHLQGNVNSSIRLGLYYNNELVSLMTFAKSKYDRNIEYELIRFCSLINTSVIGGASKLLKHFEKKYNPRSIISYANRRWSKGDLYYKLGFNFKRVSPPNYFYFTINNYNFESRLKYQKKKLHSLLDNFNPVLTESENMYNNGFRKIFDCGNLVFIKKYD